MGGGGAADNILNLTQQLKIGIGGHFARVYDLIFVSGVKQSISSLKFENKIFNLEEIKISTKIC